MAVKRRRNAHPEADIQRDIVRVLCQVLPVGAVVHHSANEQRDKKRQAILVGMGVHPGFADLLVLSDGRCLFLEVKSPTGTQTAAQRAFQGRVEAQGHPYAVVRSADDALAALGRHGFRTRIVGGAGSVPASRMRLVTAKGGL